MIGPKCKHCNDPARKVNRPRGLCWGCYYTPGVRDMYPSTSKYARCGVGNGTGAGRVLPAKGTKALPGTPEKMAVLAERAALGQRLWHPKDATHEQGAEARDEDD